jgi:hypothetical protein
MPSVAMPSPTALSSAAYELTTFADLLSITPEDISNTYFAGWGFSLKPDEPTSPDWAAQYLSPFVLDGNGNQCVNSCGVTGPSGIAYMFLDALINGNGAGIDTLEGILQDPAKPYQPDPAKPNYNPYTTPPWSISALNYYFEGGPGPGTVYLFLQPFANPGSPLYNPAIASVITLAGQGLDAFSTIYIGALDTISQLAKTVPGVGPYIYGAIQAYLGPNTSDDQFGDWSYFAGLSGILRYVTDVVLTGGNPYPPYGPPVTEPAASTLAVAAGPAAAVAAPAVVEAPAVDTVAEAPVVADSAPVSEVAESTPVAEVAEVVEITPVAEVADSAPASEIADSTPAADITPVEVESTDAAPAAVDTPADAAPEAASPAKEAKRPVRGALQRAAKSIGSALKGAPAAANADAAADAS